MYNISLRSLQSLGETISSLKNIVEPFPSSPEDNYVALTMYPWIFYRLQTYQTAIQHRGHHPELYIVCTCGYNKQARWWGNY